MRLLWFYLKTDFINHKQINITDNMKSNTYDKIKNIINLLKVFSRIFHLIALKSYMWTPKR